ncbi:hypothetical protein KAH43_05365 [Candidatus Bipolaricaulota bacterium]|nr:hypothetical protein [Candidatus Bipolaricaulota bacterium]
MTYVPLANDLTTMIDNYADNSQITDHQRQIWKAKGRKKAITHGMLGGTDHPQALRLLVSDGYDGKTVGSLSKRSAESFWYYNDNHVFPPTDDLIRFGVFMHLDVYRILAMVLKGEWESFFAKEVCKWKANVGKDLSEILLQEDKMKEALGRFNPGTDALFSRLLGHANINSTKAEANLTHHTGGDLHNLDDTVSIMMDKLPQYGILWLIEARYSPDAVDTMVQTMLLNQIHWVANDSKELDHFKRHAVAEIAVCIQGTDSEKQAYWRLTHARIQMLMDLDELHLNLESIRLQNEATNYKYLEVFGECEIALKEAIIRCFKLEQKILLKNANPELSWGEVDEQIRLRIEDMESSTIELKEQIENAELISRKLQDLERQMQIAGSRGRSLSDEDKAAYKKRCKQILRKICILIHPDRLKNDPAYEKLTPEQHEELRSILDKTLKVRVEDLGVPSIYIESKYRTPDALLASLDRAKYILENAGINIDPQLEIQGTTLPERVAWLEKDMELIEGYVGSAKAELLALMSNEDMQQKSTILASEEKHEDIKKEMQKQTAEYLMNAEELDTELQELMRGDPA